MNYSKALKQLTQQDLGEKIGFNVATLNTLLRFCDELKYNISEIVDYFPEDKKITRCCN